jgi:hypothetical protein
MKQSRRLHLATARLPFKLLDRNAFLDSPYLFMTGSSVERLVSKICYALRLGQTVLRACAPGHRVPAYSVDVEQITASGRDLTLPILKETLRCITSLVSQSA